MRRAGRVDASAKELIATAKACGCQWLPWPNGPIDGVLWQPSRQRLALVDFKSATGRKTARQLWLEADGWPILFLRTIDDVVSAMQ